MPSSPDRDVQQQLKTYSVDATQTVLYAIEVKATNAREAAELVREGEGECFGHQTDGPVRVRSVRREW